MRNPNKLISGQLLPTWAFEIHSCVPVVDWDWWWGATVDGASIYEGGGSDDGRKVKGTLHWVSAPHSINGEVRLYNHLFLNENPEIDGGNFIDNLNPSSIEILQNCKFESNLLRKGIAICIYPFYHLVHIENCH